MDAALEYGDTIWMGSWNRIVGVFMEIISKHLSLAIRVYVGFVLVYIHDYRVFETHASRTLKCVLFEDR